MQKHRAILEPKFSAVQDTLGKRLQGLDGVRWTNPNGGYFVSLEVLPGTASRVVELAGAAGVKLTPAGAPIRLAPTFPGASELEQALDVLADCIVLAAEESAG